MRRQKCMWKSHLSKMSVANICLTLLTNLRTEANSVDPDQTAPTVWSVSTLFLYNISAASADPEGGGGQGVRTPPGKSQVIWVSIGNQQLDPPGKSWAPPPPPPGKCWTPSGTLKNDRFLWNWPFDFCKISWGLKKKQKKNVRASFVRLTWTPPPLTKIPGSAHEQITKGTPFVVVGALRVNLCISYQLLLCSMCLKEVSPRDVSFMRTTFFEVIISKVINYFELLTPF